MAASRSRIHFLDEVRGFCLVLMIFFHAFYTLSSIFQMPTATALLNFFTPAEPFFAGVFIALCGFSCRLSKNNLKRGALLALVAAGMSAVLWIAMPSQMIWFGVLHCLAVCILLFALLRRALDRVPTLLGVILMIALLVLTWHAPFHKGGYIGIEPWIFSWPEAWKQQVWLAPLGIGRLYSSDYFPLLPWVFCFLLGTYLGKWKSSLPPFTKRLHIRPLAFLGRHSLIVYLVHQPIIYGMASLLSMLF